MDSLNRAKCLLTQLLRTMKNSFIDVINYLQTLFSKSINDHEEGEGVEVKGYIGYLDPKI